MNFSFSSIRAAMIPLAVIFCFSFISSFACAESMQIDISTVKIIDGDTFRDGKIKIRLWGIDAPELHQKCYQGKEEKECGLMAKTVLEKLIELGDFSCETVAKDRYQRNVARCKSGAQDVGGLLVELGYALDYDTYSRGAYKGLEQKAEQAQLGLWKYGFDKPWDWRKGTRHYSQVKPK